MENRYELTPEQQKELSEMPTSDQSAIERLLASGSSFQEAKDEVSEWKEFM